MTKEIFKLEAKLTGKITQIVNGKCMGYQTIALSGLEINASN